MSSYAARRVLQNTDRTFIQDFFLGGRGGGGGGGSFFIPT